MSRSSLTERLVDLRRAYTGENLTQAVPAVKALLHDLPDDRRERVVDALNGRGDARGLFLPDAPDDDQRALESVLFVAGLDAAGHLQLRPPASMLRPAHAFRAVEPLPHPRVHLAEHALGPLLYELLPRHDDGGVAGVAGLRVTHHPRSVELRLIGSDAAVRLAGVDDRAWEEGLRYVRTLMKGRNLTGAFVDGPLTAAERDQLAGTPRPTGLGGLLLRRYNLFTRAPWLRAMAQVDRWWVEWPRSLGVVPVADRLLHPVFGLPGAVELPAATGGLALSTGWYDLHLREVEGPDPDHEAALAALDWPEGVTGWWEPPHPVA
ncbi:hypothetical protein [Saccharothrix longispora]|uniref:hypothetical protein n=1 Tax=Saccharothrix longispora TaxID=33920 RepID=UPI0028FD9973|nr:hypothetical protein [Saccharothrix longispora]MBY8848391.1 hypothetical protein [Saccharothrix sp. MB29]MDU0289535.1 hypothetical protein [Saccharothrix longispora]